MGLNIDWFRVWGASLRKVALFVCAVVLAGASGLQAATETVNGITWTYTVTSGGARIGNGSSAAISTSKEGAVEIPSTLGGYPVVDIREDAFYNCSKLSSIAIPNSVTNIGRYAFYRCSSLTEITILDGATSIGSSAFYNCSSLTSVTIPASVTTIGTQAFSGCSSLTSIIVSEDNLNFSSVGGVLFNKDKTKLICDLTAEGTYIIPNTVTNIGDYAFSGCSNLTSVLILDSVTRIGSYAFSGCSSLAFVTMLDSVTTIGAYAFSNCKSLAYVTIPDSVTTIGNYAFNNCSSLSSVTIPDSVTSMGSSTFYGCRGLNSIRLSASMTSIGNSVFSGCSGLTSITIPNGVTRIGDQTFYGCSALSAITIPNGVTSIDDEAFYKCTGLTEVIIPSSTTYIGFWPFRDCTNLKTIKVDFDATFDVGSLITFNTAKIEYYCHWDYTVADGKATITGCSKKALGAISIPAEIDGYPVVAIGDRAFDGVDGITSIRIPEGVARIGDSVFNNCKGLASVALPDTVTVIDNNAFAGCRGLTSIIIPSAVTSIGSNVFTGCRNLQTITVDSDAGFDVYALCEGNAATLKSYVQWANKYTVVDGKATLTGLSTNVIGDVVIPGEIDGYPVVAIGDAAFKGCEWMTSVVIPGTVTNIGQEAFRACTRLASLSIGPNIAFVGDNAFDLCNRLHTLTMESERAAIPTWLEGKIAKLHLVIPNGTTNIFNDVFGSCAELVSLTIPESVEGIGQGVFAACGNLRTLTIASQNFFDGEYDYDENSLSMILEGSSIRNVVVADTVKDIGSGAFSDCRDLTSITLGNGVTNIADRAFSNCWSLRSIVIPPSVMRIGDNAFESCRNIRHLTAAWCPNGLESQITTLTIPEGTEVIPPYAFDGCTGLVSVEIPDSVKAIGYYAFSGCTNLRSITIPENVWTMGMGVFAGCRNLETLTIESDRVLNAYNVMRGPNPDGGEEDYEYYENLYMNIESLWEILSMYGDYRYPYEYFVAPLSEMLYGEGYDYETGAYETYDPIVPEIVLAGNVKYIGQGAFSNCQITSLTIPPSVTYIAEDAFRECRGIRHLTAAFCPNGLEEQITTLIIPEGTQYIPPYAFAGCTGLVSVEIPDSVKAIGFYAFAGCTGIRSITIPENVWTVGRGAFAECWNLETLTIESDRVLNAYEACRGNPDAGGEYDYEYWEGFREGLYDILEGLYLSGFGGGYPLEENIAPLSEMLRGYDYETGSTTESTIAPEIVLAGNVKYIGANAFYDCYLPSLTIPPSVTYIAEDAFRECRGIRHLTAAWCPNGLEEQITSLTIPKGTQYIPPYAFDGCTGLVSVEIPDSVKYIGEEAFLGCTSLMSITIPKNVEGMGWRVFAECGNLWTITIESPTLLCWGDNIYSEYPGTSLENILEGSSIMEVVVGGNVKGIGSGAFDGCWDLMSITIGNGVTNISDSAFRDCENLMFVTIPPSVTHIGSLAFENCENLIEICIPTEAAYASQLESLYPGAIAYYIPDTTEPDPEPSNMEWEYEVDKGVAMITGVSGSIEDEITIPSTIDGYPVTGIDDYAFYYCGDLTSITVPRCVKTIGRYAFAGCSRLTTVVIQDGVTSIGSGAFSDCASLTSFTLPASVTKIGGYAFSGCYGLMSVTIPNGVTSIGTYAFYNCSGLTSVTIPGSVMSIGDRAFDCCSGLTSAMIENGVASIGSGSFYNCRGLTSVTIPGSVTSIGDCAFDGCSGLTSATIENGVASIGSYAFYKCSSLISITIPRSMTSVGNYAFSEALNEIRLQIGASCSSQLEREYPGRIVYWDLNRPDSPAAVQASDGMYTDKVVVTWKAVDGATSYKIYRAQRNDSSDATLIASDITDTSYEDTSTIVGTKYYYWVKIVKDGEESGFSASDEGFLAVLINGIAFSTYGNQEWIFDTLDSFEAVSGDISDSQSSTLKAVVSGRGVLTFKWKVSSEYWDKLIFSVDGTQKAQISGEKDWAEISVDVSSTNGTHTFTWTYSKDGSVVKGSDCGWIKDVEWSEQTDDGVPHALIDEIAAGNSELKQLLADKGYADVANAPAANGINTIRECYITGIDPTDEEAKFKVKIEIVDGEPVITYEPDLGQERVYITEGCSELGGEWKVINTDADKKGLRFFRVKVALP